MIFATSCLMVGGPFASLPALPTPRRLSRSVRLCGRCMLHLQRRQWQRHMYLYLQQQHQLEPLPQASSVEATETGV